MDFEPFQLILATGLLTLVAVNARDLWHHARGTHWCDLEDKTINQKAEIR